MSNGLREHGDVLCQTLVSIEKTRIQIGHLVVRLVLDSQFLSASERATHSKVLLVRVSSESCSQSQAQVRFEEANHGIDKGGWKGDELPFGELPEEHLDVFLDDSLQWIVIG